MKTTEELRKEYNKLKTFGDMDRWIESMALHQKKILYDSLKAVHEFTGLDMRQEYVENILKWQVEEEYNG